MKTNMNTKSLKSYDQLKEGTTLTKRQLQVLVCLKNELGQATNRMIAKKLGWEINRVTGRVTELVNLGKVTSMNTAVDKDTNRTVTLWQVLK